MLPTTDCCAPPPDDLCDPHLPAATAWLPIRKRIINNLLGSPSTSPQPSLAATATTAAVSDKLLSAATYYCLGETPGAESAASAAPFLVDASVNPVSVSSSPPSSALMASRGMSSSSSSMESDGEVGSECGELSIDESSHNGDPAELLLTTHAAVRDERDSPPLDFSSNSSSSCGGEVTTTSNNCPATPASSESAGAEDEVKVLKIVLRRRRPLNRKLLQQLVNSGCGVGLRRVLWQSATEGGRTTATRTYPSSWLYQHAGQSVRAGVIHHSSNPSRHLTYYYLPRSQLPGGGDDLHAGGLH